MTSSSLFTQNGRVHLHIIEILSGPTKIHLPCRETGVAIPLSHCVSCGIADSQTIAATPPLLSIKMADRCPKTGLPKWASRKNLASEAYRAKGDVARNSIANRATVGHQG